MAISDHELNRWSHHHAATESVQAHTTIRDALAQHDLPAHDLFLQGSYKNGTNLRRDSDVDLVLQLEARLRLAVVVLTGSQLQSSSAHGAAYERW